MTQGKKNKETHINETSQKKKKERDMNGERKKKEYKLNTPLFTHKLNFVSVLFKLPNKKKITNQY